MGLFSFLSNKKKDHTNKKKVDSPSHQSIKIEKEFNLKNYSQGDLYKRIHDKSYVESFKMFGVSGLMFHSQLKTHLETIDVLSEYFEKEKKYDDENNLNEYDYDYSKLQDYFRSGTNINSNFSTLYLKQYVEEITLNYNNLIKLLESKGFPTEIRNNNKKNKIEFLYSVDFENQNQKTISELFKHLLNLDDLSEILDFSNQIVGWNPVSIITPFSVTYCQGEMDFKDKIETFEINSSNYDFRFFDLPMDIYCNMYFERFYKDDNYDNGLWLKHYTSSQWEFLIREYSLIKDELLEYFNFESSLLEIKKSSFDIHNKYDKFNQDVNLIIRHLTYLISEIDSVFDTLKDGLTFSFHSIGYLYPRNLTFLKFQYIESKVFEFNIIKDLTFMLIESVKEENKFLYQEIYLLIEPYHVFDKTIEKKTLKELQEINNKLDQVISELIKINENLSQINKTLTKGFTVLSSQLEGVNNKLYFNNLLTTINTYQLYKINKNTKSLKP